ncbi:c-type cytochrome [Paraburkholderia nemoris]
MKDRSDASNRAHWTGFGRYLIDRMPLRKRRLAVTCLLATGAALDMYAASAESLLARGKYLMNAVVACGNCHTTVDKNNTPIPGMELAGRDRQLPEGTYWTNPNITPDPETGIGKWTDQQIIDVLRLGKKPDGTLVTARMPIELFRTISDRDVKAIVAYLRSIPAVKHYVHPTHSRLDPPAPPGGYGPSVSVPEVQLTNRVLYGGYLARIAHCMDCHTPGDFGKKDYEHRLGAGGAMFTRWQDGTVYNVSLNITPDPVAGIGRWTDQQIKDAITKGERPGGGTLRFPMAFFYYQNMKSDDVDAIVTYLRSLPPMKGIGLAQ